jgi:hypothetical protein
LHPKQSGRPSLCQLSAEKEFRPPLSSPSTILSGHSINSADSRVHDPPEFGLRENAATMNFL